jgi:integrase
VSAKWGISFKLKDFRSTLTSVTVNGDMSRLPAMSAQLRHASMTTTQRSYYAMERGAAGRQLKDVWKEHPIKVHQNPVIDARDRLPGYG